MTGSLLLSLGLLAAAPAQVEARGPRVADERVIFHTIAGDFGVVLYPDVAPQHVRRFLEMVKRGVYDGTHFPRVEPNFVVQISNAQDRLEPLTPEQTAVLGPIKAEWSNWKHRRGILSMAREDGKPDSAESSFSILLGPAPHLDGEYTIFGAVEDGMGVIDNMLTVPRDGNKPIVRLTVYKAEVVPFSDLKNVTIGPIPIPIPAPQFDSVRQRQEIFEQIFFLNSSVLLILVLALLNYGLTKFVSPRVTTSLNLLVVLVGGFVFFVAMRPVCQQSSLVAGLMFLALVGLFRLMGRFESPA